MMPGALKSGMRPVLSDVDPAAGEMTLCFPAPRPPLYITVRMRSIEVSAANAGALAVAELAALTARDVQLLRECASNRRPPGGRPRRR
jgi:hypothetical protein